MDEVQERAVALGLRQGKVEAWRALYEAYAEQVWRGVARLMGPSSSAVADVVQETFLAAARSALTYDPMRGSLWLWLWGIARRHVALHYRTEERHGRLRAAADCTAQVLLWLEGREESPPDILATAELAALVRAALLELPADYESLLTAKYLDGASVEQIAGQCGSSSTAVRSKLARAREAFRQIFQKYSACPTDREVRGQHESP